MRWSRTIGSVGALLAAWAGLAAWQYDEYGHECDLAKESLARQADSVMNALVGGIRSHRRMGRFFPSQLQGVLEELTDSKDISLKPKPATSATSATPPPAWPTRPAIPSA